jgi:hypothetical protein
VNVNRSLDQARPSLSEDRHFPRTENDIVRLDRLGRSTRDLLNVLDEVGSAVLAFARCAMCGPTPRRRTAA